MFRAIGLSVMVVGLVLVGCGRDDVPETSSRTKTITKLAMTTTGPSYSTWFEVEQSEREGLLTDIPSVLVALETVGEYPEEDHHVRGQMTLRPCEGFPQGAVITYGVAWQRGVPEVGRTDLEIVAFCIPDVGRDVIGFKSIAKSGSISEITVYELSWRDELLVVLESVGGQLRGGIDFASWNPTTGEVTRLAGWHGDFDGLEFAHAMEMSPDGPKLTIYGLYDVKRKAYEPDRAKLEKALGVPVEFDCIPWD
jgi:hypothetical protein